MNCNNSSNMDECFRPHNSTFCGMLGDSFNVCSYARSRDFEGRSQKRVETHSIEFSLEETTLNMRC